MASPPVWSGYGGNAQHYALSKFFSQNIRRIAWSTPIDLNPQYSGNDLLIHYGSPAITNTNVVVYTIKTGTDSGFMFAGRRIWDSKLIWSSMSDYVLPAHGWTPSVSGVITPQGAFAMPMAGGGIALRAQPDMPSSSVSKTYFYGNAAHAADPADYDVAVKICTPITADSQGTIYFGFRVEGATPKGLHGGVARIDRFGNSTFVAASSLSGPLPVNHPVMNCAPALNPTGSVVYIALNDDNDHGYLAALNAKTLALVRSVPLIDPKSKTYALAIDDGTASPMVGSDGDVYFGVLEQPWYSNHDRGWLLHFDANLIPKGAPGAFGWDDTPSLVPSSAVPSYVGPSRYLLLTKYNNYAGIGGDGVNKVAILDPKNSMIDPISGSTVMSEVMTVSGVTPDQQFRSNFPNAVREWCINTAAIDPWNKCAYINSEDGVLYRWNLKTNTLDRSIRLTSGVGEAYTPTAIARDGTVFAINNATLFAVTN